MDKEIIYSYLNLPDFEILFGTKTSFVNYDAKNVYENLVPFKNFKDPDTGKELGLVWYSRYRAPTQYYNYILNIIPELKYAKITDLSFQEAVNEENHPNGCMFLPHTDGKRGKFCIHWNYHIGGSDKIKTIWWHESGYPLYREPFSHPNEKWSKGNDISHMSRVAEVIWKENTWGIFRTDILHGVHSIITSRDAFTIGFNEENVFFDIIDKYGIDV